MHDATSQFSFSNFRLAIAPGVPSSHLSALLALQRAEEPEVTISFHEVTADDLIAGLREGRYDAGMTLEGSSDPSLKSQPLWTENMAVAMPLRFPLLDQAKLTIAELLDYSVFRWPAENCPLLDQRLPSLPAVSQQNIQRVSSFEVIALWVAAGYGVGVSAQSRIEHAQGWGIHTRPLSDGPYEIVTHLQRPCGQADVVSERFERRALQVAKNAPT
ncbi:MAG: LysR family transcriptional regulator [Pseudomonadales bacterium 32-61-5]|nr:MAG: LysR family transcriptional regulator [Pseudomonadales bacterium 32-61-5]